MVAGIYIEEDKTQVTPTSSYIADLQLPQTGRELTLVLLRQGTVECHLLQSTFTSKYSYLSTRRGKKNLRMWWMLAGAQSVDWPWPRPVDRPSGRSFDFVDIAKVDRQTKTDAGSFKDTHLLRVTSKHRDPPPGPRTTDIQLHDQLVRDRPNSASYHKMTDKSTKCQAKLHASPFHTQQVKKI